MSEQGLKDRVKKVFTGPAIQGSLFSANETNGSDQRLTFRELLSLLKPSFHEPNIQASLFEQEKPAGEDSDVVQISPELLERLASRPKGAQLNIIPSLFGDFTEMGEELKRATQRKRIMATVSILAHVVLIGLLVYVAGRSFAPAPKEKPPEIVMTLPPLPPLKVQGNSKEGGGGGGGGRLEITLPSAGRLPKIAPIQLVPPDPKPIESRNDSMIADPSIILPIQITQNLSLPIGDPTSISAPPSSGPGKGGGLGTGDGTGVGSGQGKGFGPGRGAGMGGGDGTGLGPGRGPGIMGLDTAGLRQPEMLVHPLPPYTEEGRKNKIMGSVVLNVIIRKDGSVDNARIVRGLGYGLDESALKTVMTKWKFKPAILNGKPVDVEVPIEITFNLL